MADAIKTAGCTIHMSTEVGSPQSFVLIGNVMDFSGVSRDRNIIATTNLASEAATKMAGLLDGGDFNFTINYDPNLSSHANLETALGDGQAREFKITLTDSGAAEVHFNGIVKSMPINAPFDDKVTINVAVAITGKPWIVY